MGKREKLSDKKSISYTLKLSDDGDKNFLNHISLFFINKHGDSDCVVMNKEESLKLIAFFNNNFKLVKDR